MDEVKHVNGVPVSDRPQTVKELVQAIDGMYESLDARVRRLERHVASTLEPAPEVTAPVDPATPVESKSPAVDPTVDTIPDPSDSTPQ